jgi:hypothetical protein
MLQSNLLLSEIIEFLAPITVGLRIQINDWYINKGVVRGYHSKWMPNDQLNKLEPRAVLNNKLYHFNYLRWLQIKVHV